MKTVAVLLDLMCALGVVVWVTEDGCCKEPGWHLLPLSPLPAHKCHHPSAAM